jgi:hypothetical protein
MDWDRFGIETIWNEEAATEWSGSNSSDLLGDMLILSGIHEKCQSPTGARS